MLRNLLIVISMALLAGACAQMQTPDIVTPQQTVAVKAICARVVRLREGDAEFDGCVSDLSDVMAQRVQYAMAVRSYKACAAAGHARNTPDFSRCVLDQKKQAVMQGASLSDAVLRMNVADIAPADSSAQSYYSAGFDMRRQREEYACAQLGLEPGSGSFLTCVNKLDTDLFNIAHPLG